MQIIRAPWKIKVSQVMNHWSVTLFTTIITLYALFGDDCKLAFFPKSADFSFNIITLIVLVVFVIEITINALT